MHKSCRGAMNGPMALTTRLEFRQSQALVMTPQLMQAIKLLQLSNLDLAAYVEEELEKNPLLERAADDEAPVPEASSLADGDGEAPEGDFDDQGPGDWMEESLAGRDALEDRLGTRLDNVFPEDGDQSNASARNDDVVAAYSEWASVGT